MNIDFLRLFINLAETQNFSLTAKLSHRTQSAVSQAISSLEKELGFKLFFRDNKTVILTPRGHRLYGKMRILLNNFDSIIAESEGINNIIPTILRIGLAGNPFEERIVTEIIKNFHNKYPKVQVEIEHMNYNFLKEHLTDHTSDLIFDQKDDLKTIKNCSFKSIAIGKFVAVIPKSNPLSSKSKITIEDLNGEKIFLMTPSWSSPLQHKFNSKILEKLTKPDILQVNVTSAADMMVQAQLGIFITNSLVCSENYDNCNVVPFADNSALEYGVGKLRNYNSEAASLFLQELDNMALPH